MTEVDTLQCSGVLPQQDHIVMQHWRKNHKLFYSPILAEKIQKAAGVLMIAAALGLAVIAFVVESGSPTTLFAKVVLWGLGGIFLLAAVLGVSSVDPSSAATNFRGLLKEGCEILGLTPVELAESRGGRLQGLARLKLEGLADALVSTEKRYPPYHAERHEAKKCFEEAYRVFRALGLIEDTGYGPYFK